MIERLGTHLQLTHLELILHGLFGYALEGRFELAVGELDDRSRASVDYHLPSRDRSTVHRRGAGEGEGEPARLLLRREALYHGKPPSFT